MKIIKRYFCISLFILFPILLFAQSSLPYSTPKKIIAKEEPARYEFAKVLEAVSLDGGNNSFITAAFIPKFPENAKFFITISFYTKDKIKNFKKGNSKSVVFKAKNKEDLKISAAFFSTNDYEESNQAYLSIVQIRMSRKQYKLLGFNTEFKYQIHGSNYKIKVLNAEYFDELWEMNSYFSQKDSKQIVKDEPSSNDKINSNQEEAFIPPNKKLLKLHKVSSIACKEYNEGINDIQKSEIYNEVNEQKRKIGQELNWKLSNWKGNIMEISTNQGGDNADVEIVSEMNGIKISFEDISLLGFGGVAKNEEVYNQLRNLQEGASVIFSGEFEEGERGIEEISITERGSICAPELAINLTNVKLNPEGKTRKSNAEEFTEGFTEGASEMVNTLIWVFAIFIGLIIFIKILQGISNRTE